MFGSGGRVGGGGGQVDVNREVNFCENSKKKKFFFFFFFLGGGVSGRVCVCVCGGGGSRGQGGCE